MIIKIKNGVIILGYECYNPCMANPQTLLCVVIKLIMMGGNLAFHTQMHTDWINPILSSIGHGILTRLYYFIGM